MIAGPERVAHESHDGVAGRRKLKSSLLARRDVQGQRARVGEVVPLLEVERAQVAAIYARRSATSNNQIHGPALLSAGGRRLRRRCVQFTTSDCGLQDAGVFAISLEDIPGVDGCTAVLAADKVKAGKVTFSVTNNTLGFAQIFVYDAEHNLVGNNSGTFLKGGKVTFTSQLVTGQHDVNATARAARTRRCRSRSSESPATAAVSPG